MNYEITNNGVLRNCISDSEETVIHIPEGVSMIGEYAFRQWSNITKVIIPEGVTVIREYAFWECTSLVEIVFPSTLKIICPSAFKGCENLTEIHLPEGLTKIGKNAFSGCTSLKKCTIPENIESIGEDALPKKFLSKPKKESKPSKFKVENGYLSRYNEPDSDTLDDKCYGEPFEEYLQNCNGSNFPSWSKIRIPKEVTVIGEGCFSECHSVASVTIPDGVTRIEDGAFCECLNLDRVTIPESVEEIDSKIFELCFNLREISFVKNGKKVKFPFDYSDYGKSLSSLDKNGEKQMNLLTQFITAKTKEECNDIISQITSDRVKNELEKIVKKIY